ncbi:MAG: hypothetical protein APR63_01535 [Desulfuromonas sp. SDB]|nr:MAG: hypothetical protein APR63_01535 [Desulfuromonas sp. SDB]
MGGYKLAKNKRVSYQKLHTTLPVPNLLEMQKNSFKAFIQEGVSINKRKSAGLQMIFENTFPIEDPQQKCELRFIKYELGNSKYTPEEAIDKGTTYAAPLKLHLQLVIKDEQTDSFKEIREQEVFLCDLPLMTEKGNFVINGIERAIVAQLHRSPGVFFSSEYHHAGKLLVGAQIIPHKGSWLNLSLDHNDILTISLDRRRRFPITIWLQAIGLGDKAEIFDRFFGTQEVKVPRPGTKSLENMIGRIIGEDIADPVTGEIVLMAGSEVTVNVIEMLNTFDKKTLILVNHHSPSALDVIRKTFAKVKKTLTQKEAAVYVYKFHRGTDPVTPESAIDYIENIFFSAKRYFISPVGRKMMKDKLGKTPDEDALTLVPEDFIYIINYLFDFLERRQEAEVDDIDHLGNRQIRRVGELLSDHFNTALMRVVKGVRDKMLQESDYSKLSPQVLINSRFVTSTLMAFFSSSQLSQFMEQTNPLTELTHKRRLSALGPDGLTRDTAGFEVRDVHHSHYGRICPIETPEGPNIGLITSLSIYARINDYGFIETPYRKVEKGMVTDKIEYLSPHEEDKYIIAQANEPVNEHNHFTNREILARHKDDYPVVTPSQIDYMDATPIQILSASASLIPFMEHDEANRALMGSNMQRQAVSLVRTEAPLVGTGMEEIIARDSGTVVLAKRSGEVLYVDATEIRIKPNKATSVVFGEEDIDVYQLKKFSMTNQNTCINQIPIVQVGDKIRENQVIADGAATDKGELALGKNILVSFMPWRGYNFEDAIVVSERLLKEDAFTSIHIKSFTIEVRETKLGPEELTREIPNVSEDSTKNLDDEGIIRIGAEVHQDDILVGKVTPKGETELTPQEKLLKAIFGEKAADVRDTSLKVPPGVQGVVIDVKVLSRTTNSKSEKMQVQKKIKKVEDKYLQEIARIEKIRQQKIQDLIKDQILQEKLFARTGELLLDKGKKFTSSVLSNIDWNEVVLPDNPVGNNSDLLKDIITESSQIITENNRLMQNEIEVLKQGDELPHGLLKRVTVFVAQKRKLAVGDKMSGRHGNKGVVSIIVPEEDMPHMEDGTPIDILLNPLGVPSRMNVGQILETHLGWAAKKLNLKYTTPVFDGASWKNIEQELEKAGLDRTGKAQLSDGRTGQKIDGKSTVGYNYMLKLVHMVDDKIHARSIGPYSMITQQPLGGKAHFGGQRFGEMEVWALEAYGAAYTLQEMLTVKSDDVSGRKKMYETIIKGESPPEPGLPASFNVLVKELNGLCLNVEIEKDTSKLLFKDNKKSRREES